MFNTMHLFAGAGGGLLADLILGHTPIVAVEWDPYACAVLRERAADGWFPGLSVYEGDVRLFDPSEYTGRVDCIAAGFPCQDISVAGNGAGINGERSGLYREILRIADVVRPRFLFLENSPAIVGKGLGTVLGDLAARGYDGRWTVLAAADVGAPHIRERWWGLFWRPDSDGMRELQPQGCECDQRGWAGDVGGEVADPGQGRLRGPEGREMEQPRGAKVVGAGEAVADSAGVGLEKSQPSQACDEQPPASGTDRGIGWWGVEPAVGRVAHGVAARTHQIAALGNGQVPLCAAAAWCILGGSMNYDATPNVTDHRADAQGESK
jgi:DNA (cytosine-5)-methyltransferase 1